MKSIIVFVFVIVLSIFSNSSNSLADEIESNFKNNISNEMKEIRPDSNKGNDISMSSKEDIFGDEQTFPFVAGLGKNAAH